jgi:hypothetical protein
MSDDTRHVVEVPAGSDTATCRCGWTATSPGGRAEGAGSDHIVSTGFKVIRSAKLNGDVQLITGRQLDR